MSITSVQTIEEFKNKLALSNDNLLYVHFTGDWASQYSKQINDVIDELIRSRFKNTKAVEVNVDTLPQVAKDYQIDCVPTVVIFAKEVPVSRVEGVNIPLLVSKVNEATIKNFPLDADLGQNLTSAADDLEQRLKKLINTAPLMLFIKGSRDAPRCGFSKQIIALLNSINAQYETFDILKDEEVRQELKKFSDWPTYPQIYYKGELLGGLDIIKEMFESGEFQKLINN